MCRTEPTASSASSRPQIWLFLGFLFLVTLGWIWARLISVETKGCRRRHICRLMFVFVFVLSSSGSASLNRSPWPRSCPLEAYPCISLFCFVSWVEFVCVCEHGCIGLHCCFCIFCPRECVCVCWNTSISHPTSNQWCQPFLCDACSTVTEPYCTHTHATVLHKSST